MELIIGRGKYGSYAVEFLRNKNRDFTIIDVNKDCQAVRRFKINAAGSLQKSGENFVAGNLEKAVELIELLNSEFIFPTAPAHIMAEMAKIKFKLQPWPEVINCILPKLLQSIVLQVMRGNLVLSFNRDNHCKEQCSTPETCPTSKVKKPCTMTRLMAYACPDGFVLVSILWFQVWAL